MSEERKKPDPREIYQTAVVRRKSERQTEHDRLMAEAKALFDKSEQDKKDKANRRDRTVGLDSNGRKKGIVVRSQRPKAVPLKLDEPDEEAPSE